MKKLLTLLWFIPALLIGQTTYYIDPGGTDDAGRSGGVGQEWLTLGYAVTRVTTPGSTIHVNAGTYTINTTVALPVGVSLVGDGLTSILTTTNATVDFKILNLASGSLTEGNQIIKNLKFDGNSLTGSWAVDVYLRSNVEISYCTFEDFARRGVTFRTAASGPPAAFATGNKVFNCNIINCSEMVGETGYGCLAVGGQDGIEIYNDTITQTARAAGYNGYPIKYMSDGYNRRMKIHNNALTAAPKLVSNYEFAIEIWNGGGGDSIYDNRIIGCIDIGSTYRDDLYGNMKIFDNEIGYETSQATLERGIILEGEIDGVEIFRNWFKNIDQGIYIVTSANMDYFNNVSIYYNIFTNLGNTASEYQTSGIRVVGTNYAISGENFFVYNNVFEANTGSGQAKWHGIMLPDVATFTNCEIINNIVLNFRSSVYRSGNYVYDSLKIQNNIFYNNSLNSNDPLWEGSFVPTHYTYSGTLKVDPEFVGGGDYSLQVTSDAIDAALGVGLLTDYAGNVIGDSPDIGAYEYDASPPTPPPLLPAVTTVFTSAHSTIVYAGGSGIDDGGGNISKGVCYSESANPTIAGSKVSAGTGTAAFNIIIRRLTPSTDYHIRAYVTNEEGTTYGADIPITTTASTVVTSGVGAVTSGVGIVTLN